VLAYSFQRAWLGLLLLATLATRTAHATPATVVDLLWSLTSSGYDVLYSSDLVTADLTVPDSADAVDPVTRAKQALAAYHLQLQSDGQRRFIVTRATQMPAPTTVEEVRAPEEVTVFASRYVLEDDESKAAGSYTHDDIEQVPGAQQDAMRAVRTVPGLADNLSSRPYVRGSFLEDVLVRFDGVAMVDPFHFKNFQNLISAFDPATVDRIDIYTGGFPVKYGTRSGGVIDITPRALDSGYEHRIGADLLSYDASTVGHSDSLGVDWLATVRHSTPYISLQPGGGDIGEPSYLDTLSRLRWRIADNFALTAGWLMLDDEVASTPDVGIQQAVAHDRDIYAWGIVEWAPNNAVHSRSSLALTDSNRNFNGDLELPESASGQLSEYRDVNTIDMRTDWTYLQSAALLWDFGAETTIEYAELKFARQLSLDQTLANSLEVPLSTRVNSAQSLRSTTLGLYGSAQRRWRQWELEIGLRLDHQDYRHFGSHSQVSPRISLRYDPVSRWHLYGSWGEFQQAERVGEWRVEQNQIAPDPATRVVEVIAGIEHDISSRLRWRAEVYNNHWLTVHPYFDNSLNPLTLIPELGLDRILIAPRGGNSKGLELSATEHLNEQWDLSGSYTLSRTTDKLATGDVLRSWDQTHALNAALSWRQPSTSASLIFSWHSGWPQTPISLAPSQPASLEIGSRNTARWSRYISVDARVAHTFSQPLGDFDLWLDTTNLFNRGNPCCSAYGQTTTDGAFVAPSTTSWFPRIINVGFDWRFRPHH
jgi:outer membrane receptor protein involved in Fe transport